MSLNSVTILGRLTRDPENKALPSGVAVSNFSVATSESWKDKTTGVKQEKSEFHNIVAFSKLAELCNQYLLKSRQVLVQGKLSTRSWEDKDTGKKLYRTEIIANSVQFLGGKDVNDSAPVTKDAAVQSIKNVFDADSIPF